MDIHELAAELGKMHKEGLLKGEGNAQLVLFGIKYAEYLGEGRVPVERVIVQSGIRTNPSSRSFTSEINIGKQLAPYVQLRSVGQNL